MNRADVASSLLWAGVGAYVCYAGWDLELGAVNDPGSGFMIFWVGVIMLLLAAIVFVGAVRRTPGTGPQMVWGHRWKKVVMVVAALVAYAWVLSWLGFIATTFILLVLLFKFVEPQRWTVAVGGAVASALLAYAVFHLWLGAQLPPGVFELG
jgi:putative tricarboxylic transport membrane protein